jgi:hypothetical protein
MKCIQDLIPEDKGACAIVELKTQGCNADDMIINRAIYNLEGWFWMITLADIREYIFLLRCRWMARREGWEI